MFQGRILGIESLRTHFGSPHGRCEINVEERRQCAEEWAFSLLFNARAMPIALILQATFKVLPGLIFAFGAIPPFPSPVGTWVGIFFAKSLEGNRSNFYGRSILACAETACDERTPDPGVKNIGEVKLNWAIGPAFECLASVDEKLYTRSVNVSTIKVGWLIHAGVSGSERGRTQPRNLGRLREQEVCGDRVLQDPAPLLVSVQDRSMDDRLGEQG